MRTMSAATSGDSARSPPASGVLQASARARNPSKNLSIQGAALRALAFWTSSEGKPNDRKAATGRAPMAAKSLNPRARVRCPMISGECQSRLKWRPAMDKSVVTASSSLARGRSSAQSSPIPNRSAPWEDCAARRRIWRSSVSSLFLPVFLPFGFFRPVFPDCIF